MADSLVSIAAAGMTAAMARMINGATNISNSGSLAFKGLITETKDTVYNQISPSGPAGVDSEKPVGIYSGTGVKVTGTYRDLSQGTTKSTSNPLDMAIIGGGYFAILLPNNVTGYTRAGRFQVNSQRQLCTSDGFVLADNVQIPPNIDISNITISPEGVITVKDNTGTTTVLNARISLYTFANEQALLSQGSAIYTVTDESGPATAGAPNSPGYGKLQQYQVELSNVDNSTAFAEMIEAQRAYELSTRILRAADETWKELNKS
jgi:flagellar basal-body rod protein FlgG